MFSQKKKRSKGLLFLIPVLLVFLAGLALNAFMSGGADDTGDGGDAGKDADRLVSAGYDPDDSDADNDDLYGNASDRAASSDISEKESKIGTEHEYTDTDADNSGENGGAGIGSYAGEESGNEEDEYYYGSDSYSEMYDGGYSGYRAVSEDNMLVIYKYANGTVVSEERTDIQTDILPEYDRELLENGIDISSAADVDELLQDYEG